MEPCSFPELAADPPPCGWASDARSSRLGDLLRPLPLEKAQEPAGEDGLLLFSGACCRPPRSGASDACSSSLRRRLRPWRLCIIISVALLTPSWPLSLSRMLRCHHQLLRLSPVGGCAPSASRMAGRHPLRIGASMTLGGGHMVRSYPDRPGRVPPAAAPDAACVRIRCLGTGLVSVLTNLTELGLCPLVLFAFAVMCTFLLAASVSRRLNGLLQGSSRQWSLRRGGS